MGLGDHVKLVGVGKDQHMSALSNWTNGNDASVVADASSDGNPVWDAWDAGQRDLFIMDHEGIVVYQSNISSTDSQGNNWGPGVPTAVKNMIVDLIDDIPPDEPLFGDVNGDGAVNVVDVVQTVAVIMDSGYLASADINADGVVNVVDVVGLVNIIVGS